MTAVPVFSARLLSLHGDFMNDAAPVCKTRVLSPRTVNWSLFLALWGCCLFYSFQQAPLPGVNEPHYLSLARSFVDPAWCSRDPFLQSHPVHWAFFTLLGWPVSWWGFETAAIFGRLAGCATFAVAWLSLSRQLIPASLSSLWILWGTLIAAVIGNFSGEWMIGGIEGKVFAYSALFGSLSAASQRNLPYAVFWTGVAIAFHPVIGIWHLMALGGSVLFLRMLTPDLFPLETSTSPSSDSRRRRLCWIGGVVLASVGIVPAVLLLVDADPALARRATGIQVYERLAHHLNPATFPRSAFLGYGVLLLLGAGSLRLIPRTLPWRLCAFYVAWSVLFAVMGIVIGYLPLWLPGSFWGDLSPRLLKFYPFRMADVLLPWFVIAAFLSILVQQVRFQNARRSVVLLTGFLGTLWLGTLIAKPGQEQPTTLPHHVIVDWRNACEWIQNRTPVDSLWITSRRGFGFKWFAGRAEYFSYKDAPQDAAGLVAWEERQQLLGQFFVVRFSRSDLREFRGQTGVDYALLSKETPCDLKPVFANNSFAVYDLRDAESPGEE